MTGTRASCRTFHAVSMTPFAPITTATTLSRIIWFAQSLPVPGSLLSTHTSSVMGWPGEPVVVFVEPGDCGVRGRRLVVRRTPAAVAARGDQSDLHRGARRAVQGAERDRGGGRGRRGLALRRTTLRAAALRRRWTLAAASARRCEQEQRGDARETPRAAKSSARSSVTPTFRPLPESDSPSAIRSRPSADVQRRARQSTVARVCDTTLARAAGRSLAAQVLSMLGSFESNCPGLALGLGLQFAVDSYSTRALSPRSESSDRRGAAHRTARLPAWHSPTRVERRRRPTAPRPAIGELALLGARVLRRPESRPGLAERQLWQPSATRS